MTTNVKASRHRRKRQLAPYILILPAVAYLAVFMAYPFIKEIQLSFSRASLLSPNQTSGVGLDNYRTVLSDSGFASSLLTTVLYALGSVVGALLLGLVAALAMNHVSHASSFVRSAITIPWAAPPVAVALIFAWIFNNQYGVANFMLKRLGLTDRYLHWLDNPSLALPAILIVTIWMTFPICALILLAAMQSIATDQYEAATIDKASPFNRFLNVTLPGIRPTIYIVTLLLSIWALRRFDIIWVLTQGGPIRSTTTLVVELYRQAFQNRDLGLSAAIGVIGVALSLAVTVVYFVASRRAERAAGRSA